MARNISVRLDLDTKAYIEGAAEAEAVTKAVDEQMKSLDRQVSETGRDMDKMAVQAAVAKREVGSLGREAAKSAVEVKGLDERIKVARLNVGNLATSFAQSSSDIDRRNLNDAKKALNLLEKTRRDLLAFAASDTAERAAQLATAGVYDTVGKGLKEVDLKMLLLPAIATLAPGVGAVVGGAIVGAVGLGGIVGGVASAAHSPAVRQAFHEFAADISGTFFGGSSAFVQPTIDALNILKKDFANLHLDQAFAKAAPAVTILAAGLGDFAKNVMPGLNAVMDRSGPIVGALATGLGEVGHATGDFLAEIVSAPGTIDALRDSFHGLASAIKGTGDALATLAVTYEGSKTIFDKLGKPLFNAIPGFGGGPVGLNPNDVKAQQDANRALQEHQTTLQGVVSGTLAAQQAQVLQRRATEEAAAALYQAAFAASRYQTSLQKLDETVSDAVDEQLNLWRSTLDAKQALADATQTIHDNGKAWDQNSQKARDNQSAVQNALAAAKREFDAQMKAAGDNAAAQDAATRAYDAEVRKLLQLAKQAGATQKELQQLAGNYYVNIIATQHGVGSAERAADLAHQHYGSGAGFASGGYPDMTKPFWVGEQGKELMFPSLGYVMPHVQSMAYAGQPSTGGGVNVMVSVAPGADSQLLSGVMQYLRFTVNGQYAGNAQSAFTWGRR